MEILDKIKGINKYYINYRGPGHKGTDPFINSQKFALERAESFGFKSQGYTFSDIDTYFVEQNKSIFNVSRGAGLWVWKPYLILKKLNEMNDGDYLIYMDSGAYLEKSPDDYLRTIDHRGVLTFQLSIHKQSRWCKRDSFIKVFGATEKNHQDDLQILASFVFLRKCEWSVSFIKEWLNLCLDIQLVSDSPSLNPNYPDFQEHRHDQALLSLLVYKHSVMYLPDITQWCYEGGFDVNSRKIVYHHRLPS